MSAVVSIPVAPAAPAQPARPGRSAWRRAGALLWHGLSVVVGWVPVTVLGLLAVPLLCWLGLSFGRHRHDGILLVLALGGLVLLAALSVVVLLTALWLRLRRHTISAELLRLEGGTATTTGYRLGLYHLNPLIRIDVTWERPEGVEVEWLGQAGRLIEQVTPSLRGMTNEVIRIVRVSDVLGLCAVRFRQRLPQAIRCAPDCGRVQGQVVLQQAIPGDELGHPEGRPTGDLLEMRHYGPGDPLKAVLWKKYAATGQLLVRTPERALAPSPRTLAYFVAGPADEPTAGLTRALLESGALGNDYLFSADGETEVATEAAPAVDQVIRSVSCRGAGGEGLADFLARGESRGVQACILFTPARPGPWLDRVVAALARLPGPVRVFVGLDGFATGGSRGWVGRLLFRGPVEELPLRSEFRQVYDRLSRAGATVHVVQRATGQLVPESDF